MSRQEDTPKAPEGATLRVSMRNTKAEILAELRQVNAAYRLATRPKSERPVARIDVARLVACSAPEDVAGWVVDRLMPDLCFRRGDPRTRQIVEALQAYQRLAPLFQAPEVEGGPS